MRSMTGYGVAYGATTTTEIKVEIKAVNSRYLECNCSMSRDFICLEPDILKLLKTYLKRGKLNVVITTAPKASEQEHLVGEDSATGKLQLDAAKEQFAIYQQLAKLVNLPVSDPLVLALAERSGVVVNNSISELSDLDKEALLATVEKACFNLIVMRQAEGESIRRDLEDKGLQMAEIVENIKQLAPQVVPQFQERLAKRIEQLLAEDYEEYYPKQRLLNEIAIFADKCCIDEELVRLDDHLRKYKQWLEEAKAENKPHATDFAVWGKQLDFLAQELNRETNTIGSKANYVAITEQVIQLKGLVEQFREQIQNIE